MESDTMSAKHKPQTDDHQPVDLLQKLIQFDTTNPPGNEAGCISYIRELLARAGIDSEAYTRSAGRPNLIARLPGTGRSSPLLLYGHIDVVTTAHQQWEHPPFDGKLDGGYIWGRGALDMKGGIAMMLSAFLRAKSEGLQLPGDLVLTIVSDEEAGGDFGAKFLVENHSEQFQGIRYAIGEFGAFTMVIGKRRFFPIQVAEKQMCWMKATLHGAGGHGSIPVRDGAMVKLGLLLSQLNRHRLPVHITPVARDMFNSIANALGGANGLVFGQLTKPFLTNSILNLLGERGNTLAPLLHNTISPTILHGSSKVNVIPSEVSVELDGRLLPGYQPEDMLRELRQIIGNQVEVEVVRYDPGPPTADLGLFDTLCGIIKEEDPQGVPIPLLLSGVTDGRFFSRLGIQTYGFLPMLLPDDFNFTQTIHAANERIPAQAVEFGTDAIYKLLGRFGAE
jgi:acetylornithine deacetylase/succinyl-diaminopimelate desuccinylase-like protein